MNESRHLSELSLFDLNMESRKMEVLEAVLKSINEESATSEFDTIYELVNKDREKNLSKSWIYKCLSELEEEGFVVVDRIGTPNKYMATKETIAKALEDAKEEQITELQKELNECRRNEAIIRNANMQDLAKVLAGKPKGEPDNYSRLIEGNEKVRGALISEICNAASQDSIIRVSNSSGTLAGDLNERGPVEIRMLEQAANGVEFRILFFRDDSTANEPKSISSFMNDALPLLKDAVLSGHLKFRVIEGDGDTYRTVIKDEERMILYLSDTYKAEAAFLISHMDNEVLIQETVDTFDEKWEKAMDMTQMMMKAVSGVELKGEV